MNNNKLAFIICTNNELYYDECVYYLSNLNIPNDFEVEIISIENAEYMTKAYNEAMNSSDAKYKVYLHQDVFIVNKNFIYDILNIFKQPDIGMIGMAGCVKVSDFFKSYFYFNKGKLYMDTIKETFSTTCGDVISDYEEVQIIDGMIMITQYDVPWREDVFTGWHYYDLSQCMEFLKNNYRIVVPNQIKPWIMHDCGIVNYNNYHYWKSVFLKQYFRNTEDSVIIDVNQNVIHNYDNLHMTRKAFNSVYDENVTATISIVAYNRLDITKLCVESVLKYTQDINYKLILVYNENEQGKGILEYFNSVNYKNKLVIHIKANMGAPFAYQQIQKHIEGKYFVHLPNDVIVTSNWLSNMIKCAESDIKIGMINPCSSNVSNYQCVNLSFETYDEMQSAAKEYNKSDPAKWEERLRLMTLGTLFTRECLSAIGNIFDIGFMHDFGDDDVSFRVRRAGYKTILAKDTWVHHAHTEFSRTAEMLEIGRKNFYDKYYGIDAWDDVNNFSAEFIRGMKNTESSIPAILGIDVKCGTPLLEIKNKLRLFEKFSADCYAVTENAKYFIDLQTVCGAENVICQNPENDLSCFEIEMFDYIVIDKNINSYSEPFKFIKNLCRFLKKDGQLFIYLKNTYDIFAFLNMIGYRKIHNDEYSLNISVENFYDKIKEMNLNLNILEFVFYNNISQSDMDFVKSEINKISSENGEDLYYRLLIDKFALSIMKK